MKNFLRHSKLLIITLVSINIFLVSVTSLAATITSTAAGGNWATGATWLGGVVPATGDAVIIATTGAGSVQIAANLAQTAAGSVTVNNGAILNMTTAGVTISLGALTINTGGIVTVRRNLTVQGATNISGTINFGSTNATVRNMTFTGTVTINVGANWNETTTGAAATFNFANNLTNNATTFTTQARVHTFSGAGRTLSGSTATVIPSVTVTGTWTNSNTLSIATALAGAGGLTNGATGILNLNFTGAVGITTLTATTAGNTVNYGFAGTQTVKAVTYSNLTISGSGNKTILIGTTINGKFSLQGTAAAITNAPTYGAASTLEYGGSAAQTATAIEFPAASGPFNLIINNTSGVTLLNSARTLAGTLTLTSGILTIPTGATNLILSNATVIGGTPFSATKHIMTQVNTGTGAQGFLRVNNIAPNSSYFFPVGDGTNYLPVTLTLSATTVLANNSFSVCAFNGITANGTPNGTAFTPVQKNKVVDAVWTVNYNGTGTPIQLAGSTNMLLEWPASLEGTSFALNPNPLIGIAHFDGPLWGTCVGSGDNAANTATRTNVTTFSPFAVGTINSGGAPLPIKVYYFNVAKGNGFNTLNWSAACGSTQATFEMERSTDGRNFVTVNSITASQQRCLQPFNFVDNNNLTGIVFYRLKVIDIDGRVDYSSIVKINGLQTDMKLAGVLPNPVSNTAQLNIVTVKKDKVELIIVSMEGKVVQRNTVQLQAGTSIISLDVANLQKGMYVIKGMFSDGQTSSLKFAKQ